MPENSLLITTCIGLLAFGTALFSYLKSRQESAKIERITDTRMNSVELDVIDCRRLLRETEAELRQANGRVDEAEEERDEIKQELAKEQHRCAHFEIMIANQESRIRELEATVLTLMNLIKDAYKQPGARTGPA